MARVMVRNKRISELDPELKEGRNKPRLFEVLADLLQRDEALGLVFILWSGALEKIRQKAEPHWGLVAPWESATGFVIAGCLAAHRK